MRFGVVDIQQVDQKYTNCYLGFTFGLLVVYLRLRVVNRVQKYTIYSNPRLTIIGTGILLEWVEDE